MTLKRARIGLAAVGVVSILTALGGLYYNVGSLSAILPDFEYDPETPYFLYAFIPMSAICILCYLALLVCGLQFVRYQTRLSRLFVRLQFFEGIYFFSIAFLWLLPGIGNSVAAATGVANGGLMFQFLILFPCWAIPVTILSVRAIEGLDRPVQP